MKALEAAFAAKKTSGGGAGARPAKKAKVAEKEKDEENKDDEDDEDDDGEDGDGLDDIFSQLKGRKRKGAAAVAKPAGKGKGKQATGPEGGDDWFNSRGMRQSGRKYVDGLPVYTEDELLMNKGGGNLNCTHTQPLLSARLLSPTLVANGECWLDVQAPRCVRLTVSAVTERASLIRSGKRA
jgi:hypothetical protein